MKKKTKFQKVMAILIPLIVLTLIASIVMAFSITVLRIRPSDAVKTGHLTIMMALTSSLLAIAAIVFSIVSKSSEPSEEEMMEKLEEVIESVSTSDSAKV